MQVIPEHIAFARDITHLPKNPNIVYGGTYIETDSGRHADSIRKVLPGLIPIVQTQEDPQLAILKQILSSVGGGRQKQRSR